MNHNLVFLIAATALLAQTPDPFAGTWKLNVQRSKFEPNDTYRSGTRTYELVPGGTKVSWTMVTGAGQTDTGDYTVRCQDGRCSSKVVRWRQKGSRKLEGELIAGAKVTARYTRTVSSDGKTLTITFFPAEAVNPKPTAVQVWEKQ